MNRFSLCLIVCSLLSVNPSTSCLAQTKQASTPKSPAKSQFRKTYPRSKFSPQLKTVPQQGLYPVRRYRPTTTLVTRWNRGIDPTAFDIRFRVLSRTSQFRGRIEVSAIVKNIGSEAYKSGPGAQAAYLYQGNRIVAQRDFTELRPGQELKLTYTRNWDSSSPAEGEFPPEYKLMIVYDPDIGLDSNRANDDVNYRNNQKVKSGMEVNRLLR